MKAIMKTNKSYIFSLIFAALTVFSGNVWGTTNNGDVFAQISSAPSANDEIIFVKQSGDGACGTTQNTNNRNSVSITTSSNQYIYNSSDNVQVFVVKKNGSTNFGFHTGSGYIYSNSKSKNYLGTNTTAASTAPSGTAAWTMNVSSSVWTVKNASNTSYYLAFNTSSALFSQYSSNQSKPYIYKKVWSAPTALAKGTITTNSVALTITDASNANNYEIYHSTSSTAPTASSTATKTTTNKSYTLTGLNAGTTYYVWVRSKNNTYKSGWVALTGNSFTTASVTTLSTNPTSITFDDNTVDVGTDEASLSVSLSNGYKSGEYYLYGWFDDESDIDHCTFYVNEAESYTYSSGTGTQNLSPTLTISYLADKAGTYTGNFYIQGYNASYEAVNCTIPLSVTLTAGCANEVTIAKNTESHATLSFSANSIKTCDETAANRQITVSVVPADCYVAPVAASVTTSGTAVTQKSGPTWNGSTSKYDYVYEFAQNATGTTTFNVSIANKTTYAVSYNAGSTTYTSGNAISGSHVNDTKTCGTNMTLPGITFTTTGYTQTGWATTDGGSQAHALNITDYAVDAAADLYPVWTADKYDITYYDGDATSATKTFSGTHESNHPTQHTYGEATTLKGATKTGYTFGGWYANKECTGEEVTSLGAKAYTAGMTLYAKWTVNTYDVAFDANGGSGDAMTKQDFTWGVKQNLSANTYTAPLHKYFYGWNTNKTQADAGTREFQPGQEVQNLTDENGTTVTLYAVWANHTFTNYRTLCCNEWDAPALSGYETSISVGGTTTIGIGSGTTYGDVSYTSNDESVLTVDGSGEITGVAAGVTTVTVTWAGDATHCETSVTTSTITVVGEVTVTFNKNGGSGTMEDQEITVGTPTNLSANEFTAPSTCEYFYGWATSQALADAGTRAYEDGEEVTITEGMDLYAIWKTYNYTVTKGTGTGTETFELSATSVECNGEVTVTCSADASHKGDPTITITPSDAGTINGNKIQNIVKNITAVDVSYTAKDVYTVTWKVGGTALTGDALTGVTTSVMEGQVLTNLPEDPEGDALDGADTFMGWSKSELSGQGNDAPTDLFKAAGDELEIDGNVTYHAVFATKNTGSELLTKQGSSATFSAGDNLVIVATSGDDELAMYQETSGTSYVKNWAFDNNVATVKADNKKYFTLVEGETNWKLGDATNGYVYNSSSNDLAISTTNASEYTISWDNTQSKFTLYNGSKYISCRSDLTGTNKNLYRGGGSSNGIVYLDIYKYTVTPTTYSNYITKVVALSSIAISAEAGKTIKTVYKKGETLDLTNMVVTATYADASSRAVTGYTVDLDGALSTDDTKFVVTYEENGVSKTAEQAIKVYELSGIAITDGPTTTTYKSGATLSTAGMEVTATWGGEALDKIIETVDGYTVDLSTDLATTDTEFKVSYTSAGVEKTATKEIHVYDLSGISITAPNKTTYTAGDVFAPAGMVVTATWGGEALDKIVETVDGYTYSEEPLVNDADDPANVDVTISYTSNSVTKTATQEVTVNPKAKKIMTWHVANEDPFTTRIYVNDQSKYILALPDDPDPVAAGFTSDYVFKGWTTATSVEKDGSDFTKATAGTEMSNDEDFYAVFAQSYEEDVELFSETFDACNGTGANDGSWNGSIASSDIPASLTSTWTFSNAKAAKECIKAGSGGNSGSGGSAQTPSITIKGDATLIFKAAAWDASGEGTSLSLSASAGSLESSSVTLTKGAWTKYTKTLDNVANAATITFSTPSKNKRFFLDSVVVTQTQTMNRDYRLTPSAVKKPTISLEGGTYYGAQTVTLSQEDSKPIYYTLDGSNPTTESTLYTSAISLNEAGTKTLKAVAWDATATDYSLVASAEYTIVTEIDAPTMPATQKFFGESIEVEISHALSGEEGFNLQYSYDGENWTDYTSALTINDTKTVYAKATIGSLMSEANATYTKGVTVGYTKITTDAEMAIGMKFIIAYGNNAAGALSSTYLEKVALNNTQNTDEAKYITNEAVAVFELGGRSGKYTMSSEGGKLGCGGEKSVNYNGSYIQWTIAFTDGTPAIKSTNSSYSSYELKYNTSSPRFTMYSGQTAVDIFVEPFTAHTLTVKNYEGDKLTAKVVEGGSFVLTNDDKPSGYPATYKFLDKWTDGTNTYAVGDAVPMGDADMTLQPCWEVTPATNTDINTLPTSVTEIVVEDGKTLTIGADRSLDNLTVEAGGTVSGSGALSVNDLTINTEAGKSGQVMNTPSVSGNLYLEIKLCDNMDPTKYYCISAPFDVNMKGGFFWGDNGDQMVFNQDFQMFEYQGAKRANTGNGWQRVSGIMKKNTAYFIVFDNTNPKNQNIIRLKAMSNVIPVASDTTLAAHPATNGTAQENAKNSNWNGIGNPALHYVDVNLTVSVFEPGDQGFEPYVATEANGFVVGTAFFAQSTETMTFANTHYGGEYRAPRREGATNYTYCVEIAKENASRYDNRLYVMASETASTSFEEGKDLPTLNSETSNYGALIWTKNYGMRLAIEDAPLVNSKATYDLGIFAPTAGTYSISVAAPKENADLYLTYEGTIIWNLSMSEYTLDLNKGITNGYGLILRANAPSAATGIDEAESGKQKAESVQKIILDEKVFILRGGKMYDVTGKAVK